MRTNFSDTQDKRLVVLAHEYKSQGKRIEWRKVARTLPGKHFAQQLENRLRALKKNYGRELSRFQRCFFSTTAPSNIPMDKLRVLAPSQAERMIRDIFSGVSAADIGQQAGRRDKNAGDLMPSAVSSVVKMIGLIQKEDVFLDIGASLGNVAAQFAIQTNVCQSLGIEKREEFVLKGILCLRSHAPRVLRLHKVNLIHGDLLDTVLSEVLPFRAASIVFLNDFLFDERAKVVVQEELCRMPSVRVIVSTSHYCPRHRESCQSNFCAKWRVAEATYGRGSWKAHPIPIYMDKRRK